MWFVSRALRSNDRPRSSRRRRRQQPEQLVDLAEVAGDVTTDKVVQADRPSAPAGLDGRIRQRYVGPGLLAGDLGLGAGQRASDPARSTPVPGCGCRCR